MSDFNPSVAAAQAGLGKNNTLETRPHPVGAKGAAISLNECAKRIREGRNDPRIRAWAGEVLIEAGKPKDVTLQAQAILDEFRRKTMYVPDPVRTEMMVAPKNTLCLDKHGLCLRVRDCDDGVIALGSAYMSIGIPVRVLGQAFSGTSVPTHVLLEIETPQGWKAVEPTHDTYAVGEKFFATREWRIDPLSDKEAKVEGFGDFVGVGMLPVGVGAAPPEQNRFQVAVGLLLMGASLGAATYGVVTMVKAVRSRARR